MTNAPEITAEVRRARLADIVVAVANSDLKATGPPQPPRRFRIWWFEGGILLLLLSVFAMFNIAEQRRRDAWVKAVQKTGLVARLIVTWPSGLPGRIFTSRAGNLFAKRVAIAEINDAADLQRLLTVDARPTRGTCLYLFFDLTAAQRTSLQTKFPQCHIRRLVR